MSYTAPITDESVAAHDLARILPDEMWVAVIDGLVAAVGADASCLDIGIGTGAVGGRLHQRGVRVSGVDCNASMLQSLRQSYPEVPTVVGDTAALPFARDVIDLVVMAHLLHLVPDWRRALKEAVSVAAPRGIIAVNLGTSALAGRTAVSRRFLEEVSARVELGAMPGPGSTTELLDVLAEEGCTRLDPIDVKGHAARSIRDHIFRLEWNPFAWPPGTPQWALSEAAGVTTAWAEEHFGDIDERTEIPIAAGFALVRCP